MKKQNKVESQAIMNLLYIGDDESAVEYRNTFAKRQLGVLQQYTNKAKSNTIHIKKSSTAIDNLKVKNQSLGELQGYRRRSSQNKENLKNLLRKLQNSPSPRPRKISFNNDAYNDRIQTQVFESSSKSKSKYVGNKSLEMTKNSIHTFFDKKKDKDIIKGLIKAKIVEKLKKVQTKKSEKKVYNIGTKTQNLRNIGTRTTKLERHSALPAKKSTSRSNFMNLLWQEKKINNPVLARKSTKFNLSKLFY